jgi:competence protein ComEC
MNGILICFVTGVTLFHFVGELPGVSWLSLILVFPFFWHKAWLRPWMALLMGGGWSLLYASLVLQQQLPASLENSDLILEGVVDSLPVRRGNLASFQMRVISLKDERENPVELTRVQLSWYGANKPLGVGDGWRLKVRLKRPRGLQNPVGFDLQRRLFIQEIGAKGYVRAGSVNQPIEIDAGSYRVDRIRQWIATQIDQHTAQPIAAALLKALAVGDKRGIDLAAWQVFSQTGTNHLMAISGLHVGIVAGWLWYVGAWLWRRSERLCLRIPALKAGAILALIGALVYAALAGFSLPTQRALLMLSVSLGAVIFGYQVQFGRSLLLALFLVVLLDPFAPLRLGFWLSFAAVAVILWSVGGRIAPWRGWRQGVRVQGYVTLGLLPVLYHLFGQASLISPLVNLIMIPWFSLVLVPILLLGLPTLLIPVLADAWFMLLGTLAEGTYQALEWFSSLPFAMIYLPDSGEWLWFVAMLGGMLILAPGGMPGRLIGVWLYLPVWLVMPERPQEGGVRLTLLDVGQGLACVVETHRHLLIYDTGPGNGFAYRVADSTLIPYLHSQGHQRVDRLVVSNGDQDHAGGVASLQEAFPITDFLSGEPEKFDRARGCQAGESWSWGSITFKVLHPAHEESYKKANNRSCVLQIDTGDWKILLTGDIEKEAEMRLLQRYPTGLASQLLVAPHHGSNSSSSKDFVTAVDPDWVLFSTGYKNSYGFPKEEVIRRWLSHGSQILNTAQTGAIQFRITPGQTTLKPKLYREINSHYWSDNSL